MHRKQQEPDKGDNTFAAIDISTLKKPSPVLGQILTFLRVH